MSGSKRTSATRSRRRREPTNRCSAIAPCRDRRRRGCAARLQSTPRRVRRPPTKQLRSTWHVVHRPWRRHYAAAPPRAAIRPPGWPTAATAATPGRHPAPMRLLAGDSSLISRIAVGCGVGHSDEPIDDLGGGPKPTSLNFAQCPDVHGRVEHRRPRNIGDTAGVIVPLGHIQLPWTPLDSQTFGLLVGMLMALTCGGRALLNLLQSQLAFFGAIDEAVLFAKEGGEPILIRSFALSRPCCRAPPDSRRPAGTANSKICQAARSASRRRALVVRFPKVDEALRNLEKSPIGRCRAPPLCPARHTAGTPTPYHPSTIRRWHVPLMRQ